MKEKEIKDFIYHHIYEVLEDFILDYIDEFLDNFPKEIAETRGVIKNFEGKIETIENTIFQHSIGVQHVYDEFNQLRKQINFINIRKKHD